jgi:stage II sporulation protein D
VDLGLPAAPISAEIVERGRDGRALTIRFRCPDPIDRTGVDVRWRMGPGRLLGTRIHRISIVEGRMVFEGGGSGHGVGLCQWGAEGMARAGAAAGDILKTYYPGAALGRIY